MFFFFCKKFFLFDNIDGYFNAATDVVDVDENLCVVHSYLGLTGGQLASFSPSNLTGFFWRLIIGRAPFFLYVCVVYLVAVT